MRERILAVLGAVCLIAVGLLVRSQLGGSDSGDGPKGTNGGGRPVVACDPSLSAVCDALAEAGRIAANPPTLDLAGAAKPDAKIDAWITWDPAPGIANVDAPDTWATAEVLGSAPVAILSSPADLTKLRAACEADVTWPCVAHPDSSGLAVGVGDVKSAEGLARFYPLAASLVAPGQDFTSLTSSQLRAPVNSPADGQGPLADQVRTLLTAPGALNVVVGPQGAFEAARATPRGAGLVVTIPKEAGATMSATIVRRTGSKAKSLTAAQVRAVDPAATALRAAGLTGAPAALAPPERAGQLYAVRQKVA